MVELFNESPIWDYEKKIAIGEELGMTFSQVSKWNWDRRNRLRKDSLRK